MRGVINIETYADYLKCLDKELENDLIHKGLTVKKDGNLVINDKVVIHLEGNKTGLIGITCIGQEEKITGNFVFCEDDDCVDTVMGEYTLPTYGDYIVLRMDDKPDYREFKHILDIVGDTIYDITETCFPHAGGKKRKSRKSKSRKHKSRKAKPRKHKSRKNN